MSGVAVVTDTTQYLPAGGGRSPRPQPRVAVRQLGRAHRPREPTCPTTTPFYDHLRASDGDLPSTSQPSVGDFLAVYEPLIERGDDVVSIHLSGGISGTVRSAEQARDALVERGVDAGADRRARLAHGLRRARADGDRRRQRRRAAARTLRPRADAAARRCGSG